MVTIEDLGFVKKGEGGPFFASGATRLGGELPVNPDGGGLSACHPGMRGLFLHRGGDPPAAGRLRGRRRHRNARSTGAELAAVSGTGGWFCSNGTLILGGD